MKRYIFPAALICSAIIVFSFTTKTLHGEGKTVSGSREVPSFDAVEIDLPMQANITVQEGATPGIVLNTYENIMGNIKTKVKDNTLIIYCESGYSTNGDPGVTAEIKLPAIKELSINGSSRAKVNGNVTGGRFGISIAGSGSASVDELNVANFVSEISGSGSIGVNSGHVTHSNYEISGSGKIKAFGLLTKETEASISGSGSGEIFASAKLSVGISGSGRVQYKGHPPVIDKEISGSGSLKNADQ